MDIQTYNALMGASSIGLFAKNKEQTSIELNFSVQVKMKVRKISEEEAIKETAYERFSGLLTVSVTILLGLACCLFLALGEKGNDLELLIPLFLGYAPSLYAHYFSNWWHKTKVINK